MIRGSSILKNNIVSSRRFLSNGIKYTTLSNGITVASETNPQASHSTVGLYYGAGSRSEHQYCNGVSALTTNVLVQKQDPSTGVILSSHNDREYNGIIAETTNSNIEEAGKSISSIASNAEELINKSNFEDAKQQLIKQSNEIESNPKSRVLSHLASTAYQGYSLSLPIIGTTNSIKNLEQQDSLRHLSKHLVNHNVVIASSGNFDHEKLINVVEKNLKLNIASKPELKPAAFLGSEVRMRDDTMSKAYFSIAVHGEGINSPNYYIAKVAAAIFGNFNLHSTKAKYTSPKLASIVQEYDIVESYNHFSESWSDTGLWGYYAEIANKFTIDDFCHFSLKQWNRLSISISEAEVARAKAQVKTALVDELFSSKDITNDIAKKVLAVGYRHSIKEAFEKIDSITVKDVKHWGQAKVWDRDIVISGTGLIEDLLDYNRNRNEMAMLRW
ncbi:COR1 [Candida pseudojiufengensis]|uniref:COR1 n=1 Tax=Candida pseudojiufengensis TaxID=497109 RepID=UPI0022248635|nr:COR1 [Candida pseudojiufengensis]KAI5964351.1 COR1 [Candida pseudojiufengensis]